MELKAKDFKKGQKAYVLNEYRGFNKPPEISEVEVLKVGREYVYTSSVNRYNQQCHGNFLTEDCAVGHDKKLFTERKLAEEHIEALELHKKIREKFGRLKAWDFNVVELRRIYGIIEEADKRG